MSYIGRSVDAIDNISTLDNLSFNGSLQTFNLTQNSVAFTPVSADALQIQIDGIIQAGNYTVANATVTFDFTPSGSSVCNSIKHFGVGLLSEPSDGSVTQAKLGAEAVNESKIQISNAGSNGQFLSKQSGNTGGLTWASGGLDGVTTGSGNVTISNGNLVLGTSGKGIDFSATSGTGTSEILSDYEEGTFTPTWELVGATLNSTASTYGYYIKIGKQVTLWYGGVMTTSAAGTYYRITNAPFQSDIVSGGAIGAGSEYGQTGKMQRIWIDDNSTTVNNYNYDTTNVANAYLKCTITYKVD